MKKVWKFLSDALITASASLVIRTIAVSFNSFVTARVGAAGMGLYTLVCSVYLFAVTFATSGINLGVTRTVSEAMGRGSHGAVRAQVRRALLYAVCFGGMASLLLFSCADLIGTSLLGDVRTVKSIRIFSLSLMPIALSSALNGYFCAVKRVWKNATTQLFEQFVKILVSVWLLTALADNGIEYACVALVCGGACAEILSVFLAAGFYLTDRTRRKNRTVADDRPGGTQRLLGITLPVSLSAYVRSALVTVEHMLIPRGLQKSGLGRDAALASYGVIQGMVLPVVLYPAAFSTAFSSLLVPELAERTAARDEAGRDRIIRRAIYGILAFSVCAAGVMISAAPELGRLLYPGTDAGKWIGILACLIPVMYLDTVTDGMLKGIGEQVCVMAVNIADASLSVLLVWTLTPLYGIPGYVCIIIGCEVLNTALSLGRLFAVTHVRVCPFRAVVLPLACVLCATRFAGIFFLRMTLMPDWAALVLYIVIAVLCYTALMLAADCLLAFIRRQRTCKARRGVI